MEKDMEEDKAAFERDIELENIFGRLFVADYVVDRLLSRMDDKIAFVYNRDKEAHGSSFVFLYNGMQYEISLEVIRGQTKEQDDQDEDEEDDIWTELLFGAD
jgi:hypothetical protein